MPSAAPRAQSKGLDRGPAGRRSGRANYWGRPAGLRYAGVSAGRRYDDEVPGTCAHTEPPTHSGPAALPCRELPPALLMTAFVRSLGPFFPPPGEYGLLAPTPVLAAQESRGENAKREGTACACMHALLAGRDRTPPLPPLGEAIALTSNDEARDGVVVTLETGPDWTPVCMVAGLVGFSPLARRRQGPRLSSCAMVSEYLCGTDRGTLVLGLLLLCHYLSCPSTSCTGQCISGATITEA